MATTAAEARFDYGDHSQIQVFVSTTKAEIRNGSIAARYRHDQDCIEMPSVERFVGTTKSTATKELASYAAESKVSPRLRRGFLLCCQHNEFLRHRGHKRDAWNLKTRATSNIQVSSIGIRATMTSVKRNIAEFAHKKISYTARGVALARSFSDIPYSTEIAELCGAARIPSADRQVYVDLSPYFEARFKAISNLLIRGQYVNILELAAGFSPRGLMHSDNSEICYIETDLPDVIQEKRQILNDLMSQKDQPIPSNLNFSVLNVLDEKQFYNVAKRFRQGPIAIVHEGLLAYFTNDEKTRLAEIVHNVLRAHSGVWITPDILTRADLKKTAPTVRDREAIRKSLSETQRDYKSNAFADINASKNFFSTLGFNFAIHSLEETAGQLTVRSADPARVRDQLSLKVWELTVN